MFDDVSESTALDIPEWLATNTGEGTDPRHAKLLLSIEIFESITQTVRLSYLAGSCAVAVEGEMARKQSNKTGKPIRQ